MTAAPASQLQTLHDQLADINTDITLLASPIQEVDDLLGKIEDALKRPAKINKDLGDVEAALKDLKKASSDATWMPEIGEDAQMVAEALETTVDVIDQIRRALSDIEKALDNFENWLEKVKKPVDKVLNPIHRVELEVSRFFKGTGRLIDQLGSNPPPNVESCAGGFSRGLAPVVSVLDDAKDRAVAALNDAEKPLRAVEHALASIVDYVDVVQTIYNDLAWLQNATRVISKEVDKAESYGKTLFEKLVTKKAGQFILGKDNYNKLMKGLSKAKDLLHRLEAKITGYAFKPIQQIVKKAEDKLEEELEALPGVTALQEAADQVIAEFNKIEAFIADELTAPCADLLRDEKQAASFSRSKNS